MKQIVLFQKDCKGNYRRSEFTATLPDDCVEDYLKAMLKAMVTILRDHLVGYQKVDESEIASALDNARLIFRGPDYCEFEFNHPQHIFPEGWEIYILEVPSNTEDRVITLSGRSDAILS